MCTRDDLVEMLTDRNIDLSIGMRDNGRAR